MSAEAFEYQRHTYDQLYLTDQESANIYIASGEGNPCFAEKVAGEMGLKLGKVELDWHPDQEPYVKIDETITKKQVVLIQSQVAVGDKSSSDMFSQYLGMINSAANGDPDELLLLIPWATGARSDRQATRREAVYAIANVQAMLSVAGSVPKVKLMTIDHHNPDLLNSFQPYYNLTGQLKLRDKANDRIGDNDRGEYVVATPDTGHNKQSQKHAEKLGLELVNIPPKIKNKGGIFRPSTRVAGLKGKNVFIFDDMISGGGTLVSAAESAVQSGAKSVHALATHPQMVEPATQRIIESPVDSLTVGNTIDVSGVREIFAAAGKEMIITNMAAMAGQSVIRVLTGRGSVSGDMFGGQNHR